MKIGLKVDRKKAKKKKKNRQNANNVYNIIQVVLYTLNPFGICVCFFGKQKEEKHVKMSQQQQQHTTRKGNGEKIIARA